MTNVHPTASVCPPILRMLEVTAKFVVCVSDV